MTILKSIDIQKVDYFDNPIIILDDYNPNNTNIRNSIELKVKEGVIKMDTYIGVNNKVIN